MKKYINEFLLLTILLSLTVFAQEPKKELQDFVFRQRVAIAPSTIPNNWFAGYGLRISRNTVVDSNFLFKNYIAFGNMLSVPIYWNQKQTAWVEMLGDTIQPRLKFVTKDDGTNTEDIATALEVHNNSNTAILSRVRVLGDGTARFGNGTYDYYTTSITNHEWLIGGTPQMTLTGNAFQVFPTMIANDLETSVLKPTWINHSINFDYIGTTVDSGAIQEFTIIGSEASNTKTRVNLPAVTESTLGRTYTFVVLRSGGTINFYPVSDNAFLGIWDNGLSYAFAVSETNSTVTLLAAKAPNTNTPTAWGYGYIILSTRQ